MAASNIARGESCTGPRRGRQTCAMHMWLFSCEEACDCPIGCTGLTHDCFYSSIRLCRHREERTESPRPAAWQAWQRVTLMAKTMLGYNMPCQADSVIESTPNDKTADILTSANSTVMLVHADAPTSRCGWLLSHLNHGKGSFAEPFSFIRQSCMQSCWATLDSVVNMDA